MLVTQSWPTLCDPLDCSLPDSSVHRILQARILEWVAIPFSRGYSWPRDQNWVSCIAGIQISLSSEPLGLWPDLSLITFLMALSLNTVTLWVLGFQCIHFGETVQFIVLLQLYHLPKSSHPILSSAFMESLLLNTVLLDDVNIIIKCMAFHVSLHLTE